jgi:hypothetical protein
MDKLGIIVPYKDRPQQLYDFKLKLASYLLTNNIKYELIIVEQNDTKGFNRGKLLNVGFKKAKALGCTYVCFHDVDMHPVKVDYSTVDRPTQLANRFIYEEGVQRTITDDYFGGVTLFPASQFEDINGYSNEYWGWGFEDNDLLARCREKGIPLANRFYRQNGVNGIGLEFNGDSSFVRFPNVCNFRKPITIYTTFRPYRVKPNPLEISDESAVFSIPGQDLNLSYNSFSTYKFETFNKYGEPHSIHTKNLPPLVSKSIVIINPRTKKIEFYLNGEKVGTKGIKDTLHPYWDQEYMYLGVGDPLREQNQKYFYGYITEFAVFSRELLDEEIKSLNNNSRYSLTQEFGRYSPGNELEVYYDGRHTTGNLLKDLSGNNKDGQIFNCGLVETYQPEEYTQLVPTRRYGTFSVLKHKENGYKDGYWVNWASRENQMRYFEKIKSGLTLDNDGLSSLRYKELSYKSKDNYHHLVVTL